MLSAKFSYPELYECLEKLNREQKTVIHLRFWDSLTIEQIATLLNLPWSKVDNIIDETLMKLKEDLWDFKIAKSQIS